MKTVGPSSVRKELFFLSAIFNVSRREWGLTLENPVDLIEKPTLNNERNVFLTEKQASSLIKECKKSRNKMLYPFTLTLLQSGMRAREAALLKPGTVNIKDRYFDLGKTKNGDPRRPPMTKTLQKVLKPILKGRDPEDYIFLPGKKNLDTDPEPAKSFRSAFEFARSRAELDHVHMHDLRHTAASYLLMGGCDLRTLADILGHRTMQMVKRYTHLLDGFKIQEIDKLDQLGIQDNE